MNIPTRPQIESLIAQSEGPYVSIYMPTHRKSVETLQDPIRMKNLIREASRQLQETGCPPDDIKPFMRPLSDLLEDYKFWQHQMDGLVIFRSRKIFEVYHVDIPVPELAVVSERPHLKPMLALISGDARFFVLTLSQNNTRLFQGTREGLNEVEVDDMPRSLDETLQKRDQSDLQMHSVSSAKGGVSQMFHGQGSGVDANKERLLPYFHRIDQAVRDYIREPGTPLILAGVDYLVPIYRKASGHAGLQEHWVSGNADALSAGALHARALPIALEFFEGCRRDAADRYLQLWHTQRASNELTDVIPAAAGGRVETLFAAIGVQIWGSYNAASGDVQISARHASGEQDLLNLAAVQSYSMGAAVYAVAPGDVPGGKAIAAVYRY